MILGSGDACARKNLHFPKAKATVRVHLLALVLRSIKTVKIKGIIRGIPRKLAWRLQQRLRTFLCGKSRKTTNWRLGSSWSRPGSSGWSGAGWRLQLLGLPLLPPFIQQHIPGNSSAGKTCSFPRYDLPLNSVTPADHHAATGPIKRREENGGGGSEKNTQNTHKNTWEATSSPSAGEKTEIRSF